MQQKSALCMSTKRAAELRPKGTFGKRLPGAGAAEAAEAVVGMCHRRQHHRHHQTHHHRHHPELGTSRVSRMHALQVLWDLI